MRLNEIDKTEFKRKLKYPMELVDGITKEIKSVNDDFGKQDWLEIETDREFGDDYVAWNIELRYDPKGAKSEVMADAIQSIYKAIVRNYQWEDVSLSYHLINSRPNYLLMGIQLDV